MTDIDPTARPDRPGTDCVAYAVVALDGRAGRVHTSTYAAPRDHIVVRGRLAERWRRTLVRRDAVSLVDPAARIVRVPLTRAEIRHLPEVGAPRVGNGVFVTGALAVILSASLVIGGWIAIVAIATAVVTAGRLLIDSYDGSR